MRRRRSDPDRLPAVGTRSTPELEAAATAARDGSRDAFDQLVRETYPETFRLALALTGDPDDAHDVAQDTYLRAFRSIGRFRGDASVLTWLYRITTNCAHTLRRHRSRHAHEELAPDLVLPDRRHDLDPAWRAQQRATQDQLAEALAQLPPKQREVIVLRDVHDLPHAEIALRLGIGESAAKVRLHRARRRLHDLVFAQGETADGLGRVDPVDRFGESA